MEQNQFKLFLSKVESDNNLKDEYKNLKTKDAVIGMADKLGFKISNEDLDNHFNEDEVNLDNISGGVGSSSEVHRAIEE